MLIVVLLASGIGVSSAQAAATMQLSVAADPAESITTQLGANGNGDGNPDYLVLKVKSAGGQGCAANPSADNGDDVINSASEDNATYSETRNWTFDAAGSYLLCGWLARQDNSSVVATASQSISVRPPHLSLAISVPASVQTGQTFQVATTAQAETSRYASEYILPDTGSGCPANASAASGSSGEISASFNSWNVVGGPFTQTLNETLSGQGTYLICAYFEYPSAQSPPEATASAKTTVMPPPPPCVVPKFASTTTLAAVEAALRAADCTVGKVRYASSLRVGRGDVVALNPTPGKTLAAGGAVDIVVSTGPPCLVPAIRSGAGVASVERRIIAANCAVGGISHARSRTVRRGRVIRLALRAGTRLAAGARVNLVVSRGKPRRKH
jgi:hypothetical protein